MSNNIKIFFWAPFTSKVGTVTNVINAAYSLAKFQKKKIDISLINVFGEWNFVRENFKNDIKFLNFYKLNFFSRVKKEGFIKSRLSYIFIFLISLIPLFRILKKEKPHYLNVHLITVLPFILFYFFKFETKLILSIAGYPKLNFFRKFLWKKISNKIYKITCPSNELKEELIKHNIFDEEKIFVIQDPHLQIHKINKYKMEEIDNKIPSDHKILISIGRLTKQKNFKFLIKNFHEIQKKNNKLKLIIIGDGEQKEKLLLQIRKLNLEKKIEIIGYKKNIYNFLRRSDYYVSTSNWEGSSLSMIDAAYIGIPILCSDCPTGRKEFIGNNKRGYLYMNDNDEDFIKKMYEMLDEEEHEIKKKLVLAKKETKKFTLFQYGSNFIKLIKNI